MFSNDLMTKDLYPGYKENTQNAITKKKMHTKMVKNLNRHYIRENVQRANISMRGWSNLYSEI